MSVRICVTIMQVGRAIAFAYCCSWLRGLLSELEWLFLALLAVGACVSTSGASTSSSDASTSSSGASTSSSDASDSSSCGLSFCSLGSRTLTFAENVAVRAACDHHLRVKGWVAMYRFYIPREEVNPQALSTGFRGTRFMLYLFLYSWAQGNHVWALV